MFPNGMKVTMKKIIGAFDFYLYPTLDDFEEAEGRYLTVRNSGLCVGSVLRNEQF